jgi:hypothetical protein
LSFFLLSGRGLTKLGQRHDAKGEPTLLGRPKAERFGPLGGKHLGNRVWQVEEIAPDSIVGRWSPCQDMRSSFIRLTFGFLIVAAGVTGRFAHRPVRGSFENGWPLEIQQAVLSRWAGYGL